MKNIDITIHNHLPEWKQIIKETKLNIEIKINDGLEFNANARFIKQKDEYLISINKGVFKKVYDFYHSVLTEDNPKFVLMAKYPIENVDDYIYNENEAKTLADFYVYLSLKFIFLHELGHIMNGHLAYLQSINSDQARFNLSMNLKDGDCVRGITTNQYQMLEIDADSFAATNMMIALLNNYSNPEATYIDRFKPVIPTTHHLPLLAITANIILMSLQGMGAKRPVNDITTKNYIPMRMRLYEILSVFVKAYNNFSEKEQTTIKEISQLVKPFENLINQYLVEVGYFDSSILSEENNTWELDKEVYSYTKNLYYHTWPPLKDNLEHYAFVPLAD